MGSKVPELSESTSHLPHSVDHWEVPQAHRPEQVEDLGDAGVGGHCVGTRVHVRGDILGTHNNHHMVFDKSASSEWRLGCSYHDHARVEQRQVQVVDVRVTRVIFRHLGIRQSGLGGAL